MQVFGFPGAFASAAKIASRCRFKDAEDQPDPSDVEHPDCEANRQREPLPAAQPSSI